MFNNENVVSNKFLIFNTTFTKDHTTPPLEGEQFLFKSQMMSHLSSHFFKFLEVTSRHHQTNSWEATIPTKYCTSTSSNFGAENGLKIHALKVNTAPICFYISSLIQGYNLFTFRKNGVLVFDLKL